MRSAQPTTRSILSKVRMSASSKRKFGLSSWAARFARTPVDRSSTTWTWSPRARWRSTRWEPMNPAPPVTRMCMGALPLVRASNRCAASRNVMAFPFQTQTACHGGQQGEETTLSGGPVVAALPGAVPRADPRDVPGHVIGQLENGADPDDLLRIMEVSRQYRHVGRLCDFPESGLPALHRLAGALGRQAEPELIGLGNH